MASVNVPPTSVDLQEDAQSYEDVTVMTLLVNPISNKRCIFVFLFIFLWFVFEHIKCMKNLLALCLEQIIKNSQSTNVVLRMIQCFPEFTE